MTHAEKVLALLSDGQPHGHMEGYRLGVMLHSRVADLRKRGHDIRCWRDGDSYVYQLRSVRPAGGDRAAEPNGSFPADRTAPRHPAVHSPTADGEGSPPAAPGFLPIDQGRPLTQLTVWEAA